MEGKELTDNIIRNIVTEVLRECKNHQIRGSAEFIAFYVSQRLKAQTHGNLLHSFRSACCNWIPTEAWLMSFSPIAKKSRVSSSTWWVSWGRKTTRNSSLWGCSTNSAATSRSWTKPSFISGKSRLFRTQMWNMLSISGGDSVWSSIRYYSTL